MATAPIKAPNNFQPVTTESVLHAGFAKQAPSFIRPSRPRGRRAAGVRYEKHVQEVFEKLTPTYIRSPWIRFYVRGGQRERWCQPDGFFFDIRTGVITIVEIKYQHTTKSWWQLRKLYEPLLAYFFPRSLFTFALLEVVSWYDPHTHFPERHYFAPDPLQARPGEFGVHILAKGGKLSRSTLERLSEQ